MVCCVIDIAVPWKESRLEVDDRTGYDLCCPVVNSAALTVNGQDTVLIRMHVDCSIGLICGQLQNSVIRHRQIFFKENVNEITLMCSVCTSK